MEGGVERLPFHPHRRDPELLEHVDQLFVEPLIAAVEGLGLLALGVELLAGAVEVVDHRQDLAEGAAGDLDARIFLIPTLALAEVVEIGGHPHVLPAQTFVLRLKGGQTGLQFGHAIRAPSHRIAASFLLGWLGNGFGTG
jgi:hypothetical protein